MNEPCIVDRLLDQADIGGEHHSPCFRDCLYDNREWVEREIAATLNRVIKRERERCAQVAEDFEWTKDADNSDLAAAIRALKDET